MQVCHTHAVTLLICTHALHSIGTPHFLMQIFYTFVGEEFIPTAPKILRKPHGNVSVAVTSPCATSAATEVQQPQVEV